MKVGEVEINIKRGDKEEVPCPICLAEGKKKKDGSPIMVKGWTGFKTHKAWQHSRIGRAKRLAAAQKVGRDRMLRNRGMLVPASAAKEKLNQAKRNWYARNRERLSEERRIKTGRPAKMGRPRKFEVEMEAPEVRPNWSWQEPQTLQRAATASESVTRFMQQIARQASATNSDVEPAPDMKQLRRMLGIALVSVQAAIDALPHES
jgi:hypothetical protein